MSNNHFEDGVLLRAIDQELPPPQTSQVKRHIEECASCRERFDRLRRITARLAEHQRDVLDGGPAAALAERERFLGRLNLEPSGRPRRPGWLTWGLTPRFAVCAVLSLVILGGVLLWTRHARPSVMQAVRPRPVQAAPIAPKEFAPRQSAGLVKPPRATRTAHRMVKQRVPAKRAVAEAASTEIATPFFALPFSDASLPLTQAAVIRVELPRSALAMTGLPVDEDRRSERVDADVVVGADGLARAIRFVHLVR